MKLVVLALPTLLLIGVVAGLCMTSTSATAPRIFNPQTTGEVEQLRLQRDQIQVRLEFLEGKTHVFLPRGMGRMADKLAAGTPLPAANLLAPQQESR